MASGSVGQVSTTANKSGSKRPFCVPSAPLSAPLSGADRPFLGVFAVGSNPVPATFFIHAQTALTLPANVGSAT